MNKYEAKRNVELAGLAYRDAMKDVGVADKDTTKTLLEAGLVCYYYCDIKDQYDWLDESVSILMIEAMKHLNEGI